MDCEMDVEQEEWEQSENSKKHWMTQCTPQQAGVTKKTSELIMVKI